MGPEEEEEEEEDGSTLQMPVLAGTWTGLSLGTTIYSKLRRLAETLAFCLFVCFHSS